MSPPIFNPDGSEVSEIVLPDGSTASEVIGPDGNVVFEAAPDIPDSAIHQWDAQSVTASDGDTVPSLNDQIGGVDAIATSGPTYDADGINGNPAIRLDGTSDYYTASFSQAQPLTIIAVVDVRGGTNNYVYSSDSAGSHPHFNVGTDDTIIDFGADSTISDADESGSAIWTTVLDGASSVVRRSASSLFSGDSGSDGVTADFRIGERSGGVAEMTVGEYVVYNAPLSQSVYESEEQRLSNKWGISLA